MIFKKIQTLLFVFVIVIIMLPTSVFYANEKDEVIEELRKIAKDNHYRFIGITKDGFTEEIKKELAENDQMFIEEKPRGSITLQVLDAGTKKPVSDATCFLISKANWSNQKDEEYKQKSNPFLVFELGKTPNSGLIKYEKTYFFKQTNPYQSDIIIDKLLAPTAVILDDNPDVTLNLLDLSVNNFFTNSPEFNVIKEVLKDTKTIKFNDLDSLVKSKVQQNPNYFIENMFLYDIAKYSENTRIQLYDKPEYKKLIQNNKKIMTIGELRQYIDSNLELFNREVASRYYDDFGGFIPTYRFRFHIPNEYKIYYKDGKTDITKHPAEVLLNIFDDDKRGTGKALISWSFQYSVYINHPNYKSGECKGDIIMQDLINKDIKATILLSNKDDPKIILQNNTITESNNLTNNNLKDIYEVFPGQKIALTGILDLPPKTNRIRVVAERIDGLFKYKGELFAQNIKDNKFNLNKVTFSSLGKYYSVPGTFRLKIYAVNLKGSKELATTTIKVIDPIVFKEVRYLPLSDEIYLRACINERLGLEKKSPSECPNVWVSIFNMDTNKWLYLLPDKNTKMTKVSSNVYEMYFPAFKLLRNSNLKFIFNVGGYSVSDSIVLSNDKVLKITPIPKK